MGHRSSTTFRTRGSSHLARTTAARRMTMNRRNALLAVAAMLSCLATAAPALAADQQDEPSALGTHLKYRTTTWTSQGADMSIMAPRGWSFVLTPEGQARFNADGRPDVLAMGYRGEGELRPELQSKVEALQGTPGLRILVARGQGRGDSAYGELRYVWTPEGGEARFVDYRYQGNDAYTVAGRLADRKGLEAVLNTASSPGEGSGPCPETAMTGASPANPLLGPLEPVATSVAECEAVRALSRTAHGG